MRQFFDFFRSRLVFRRCEIILVGSVLLLSGAVIPSSWGPPQTAAMGGLPAPVPRRPEIQVPSRPWIALTFDDGPHPVMTERLLRILQKEGVPATFFVVGKMAERHPQIVQAMARDGHEIENHTYSHPRLTHLDDDAVLKELALTRGVIRRLTGRDSFLFRPPGGDYDRHTLRATAQAGYRMVLWSVLTNDVQGVSQRAIYRRILKGVEDGGIVLMHSGIENTVEILPQIIATLRQRGYHFVTVSTLVGSSGDPGAPEEAPLPLLAASPAGGDHNDLQ